LIGTDTAMLPSEGEHLAGDAMGRSTGPAVTAEWSPEGHSWILVPADTGASDVASDAEPSPRPALPTMGQPSWQTQSATSDDGAAHAPPDHESSAAALNAPLPTEVEAALNDPLPTENEAAKDEAPEDKAREAEATETGPAALQTPAPSPKTLSDSLLEYGETVAALAVSEILSPGCPLPGEHRALSSSDASCGSRTPTWEEDDETGPVTQVAPPDTKACAHCGAALTTPPPDGEFDGQAFPLASLCAPLWSRPLAVVVVLVATHAATLLLGVVLGRSTHSTAAEGTECLARRFSSGPYGSHARLSWSN